MDPVVTGPSVPPTLKGLKSAAATSSGSHIATASSDLDDVAHPTPALRNTAFAFVFFVVFAAAFVWLGGIRCAQHILFGRKYDQYGRLRAGDLEQ